MAASFVGRGIAFPLGRDASGRLALVSGSADVERSIRLVLATYPGERPMRPDFGSTIADHVFAPADATTAGRLAHAVRSALEQWEPRIDLDDVVVHLDGAQEGVLYIEVVYRLRGTNDPRNLVFPFYVIPDHHAVAGRPDDDGTGALTTSGPAAALSDGRR